MRVSIVVFVLSLCKDWEKPRNPLSPDIIFSLISTLELDDSPRVYFQSEVALYMSSKRIFWGYVIKEDILKLLEESPLHANQKRSKIIN